MTTIDDSKLENFVHQAVGGMAAAISGLLLHIGDRLGLYKGLAGGGPISAEALAVQTGTATRYVREWLSNQAASTSASRADTPTAPGGTCACPTPPIPPTNPRGPRRRPLYSMAKERVTVPGGAASSQDRKPVTVVGAMAISTGAR
jgi:hypothetical protein